MRDLVPAACLGTDEAASNPYLRLGSKVEAEGACLFPLCAFIGTTWESNETCTPSEQAAGGAP
jgi:hypothetical protein